MSGAGSPAVAETLLAFDFGRKWIGVAIGNTVSGEARPLEALASEPVARRFERIAVLLETWGADRLVVGLPLGAQGEEQAMSEAARRFARQLEGRFRRPVVLVDERYSSLAAQSGRSGAGRDDPDAAAVILRQYLHERSSRH